MMINIFTATLFSLSFLVSIKDGLHLHSLMEGVREEREREMVMFDTFFIHLLHFQLEQNSRRREETIQSVCVREVQ